MTTQRFGAGIWHFATYLDRYATDGYGIPRNIIEAIDLAGQSRLGEPRANAGGQIGHGYGLVEVPLAAIWKSNYGHSIISRSGTPVGMVRASGIEPLTPTMSR